MMQAQGMRLTYARRWSDYHETEYPGGRFEGRSLVAEVFNLRRLGDQEQNLRTWGFPSPPIRTYEASPLLLNGRTLRSKLTMARVGLRLAQNRLGRRLAGMGTALYGRMLEIALAQGISFRLGIESAWLHRGRRPASSACASRQ